MTNNRFSILKGLALISQIGLQMIVPIVAAVYFGHLLDQRLHTGNVFLIIFILCGVVMGFLNVYKLVMKDISENTKKK